MVPTVKEHWPRQIQPWTRGDESDDEDAQAAKKRWLARRRRQDRVTRRNDLDNTVAGPSAPRLARRQEVVTDTEESSDGISEEFSESSGDEAESSGGGGQPAPTSRSPSALPVPSSAPELSTTETTSLRARPTTFRPMPEPSVSRTSSEAEPESTTSTPVPNAGAPMTTVTVGDEEPTGTWLSISTSTATEGAFTSPTLSFPVLPSEIRKGVDGPSPTADPVKDSTPADKIENKPDDNGNGSSSGTHQIAPTHAAMHALGSIGGILVIAAFLVFVWWYFKKYRTEKRKDMDDLPLPPPQQSSSPSSSLSGLLGKFLPLGRFSKKSTQDREWRVESAPSIVPGSIEKEMQLETGQEYAYQRGIEATGEPYYVPAQLAASTPPTYADAANGADLWTMAYAEKDGRQGHAPNQPSISSTAAQPYNTLRINAPYYKRTSEVSSLSSGFGDGELPMAPSTAHNTMDEAGLTQLRPPPPAANPRRLSTRTESTSRDTWYTEASEDQPARFRTINSWVRQQTGRIKREKQRRAQSDVPPVPALPAEEEYRMMMPDGEEPRRVDASMSMDIGVAYGGTR